MHLLKLRGAQIYNRVTSEYTQVKTKFYFLCNVCIMRRMHLKLLQMNELRDSPWPFKLQYPQTNSPNWSLYISLQNQLGEIDKRSEIFLSVIIWLILIDVALDNLGILLGENWRWSLLGLKGLKKFNVGSEKVKQKVCYNYNQLGG